MSTRPRRTLVLAGEAEWARQQASEWLQGSVLWIGDIAPPGVAGLPVSQARQALGEECDTLVFDAHGGLDPDALGAACGTLRGGGLLLLLTPGFTEWPAFADPDKQRYASHPLDGDAVAGRFIERLIGVLQQGVGISICHQGERPEAPPCTDGVSAEPVQDPACRTADQSLAVVAVMRVAQGHRRRPLVLTADRGRGKSAALGIAAARLLQMGLLDILVTAPRWAAVAALFEHAERLLPGAVRVGNQLQWQKGVLRFLGPDELLRQAPHPELVLVDEAAAIPVPLLASLLQRHARIVFSSTVHGYEGSGRGFALRFRQLLNERCPQWQALSLTAPIRYPAGDPLESWLSRALLLDAEPAVPEVFAGLDPGEAVIAPVVQAELAADEALLRQVFGLLVQAHYQTRPADLRQLLDAPGLTLWLARMGNSVAAVCVVLAEGGLDAEVAAAVSAGHRRPRGHLVPQGLAQHAGQAALAQQRCARVMRIAVHPALQRRGLGRRLLARVATAAHHDGLDWWGASFAADPASLGFWQAAGCGALRLGLARDAASGNHSAILLEPLSAAAQAAHGLLRQRFCEQLAHGLADNWRNLEPAVARALLRRDTATAPLTDWDLAELGAFAAGRRDLAASQLALWRLTVAAAGRGDLIDADADLLVRRILQRWPDAEVIAEAGLNGRRELHQRLRTLVAGLLSQGLC